MNTNQEKPSVKKVAIMTICVIVALILLGYFFGEKPGETQNDDTSSTAMVSSGWDWDL